MDEVEKGPPCIRHKSNMRYQGNYKRRRHTDVASRGCTVEQLLNNDLWWKGPQFLLDDEQLWPKDDIQESYIPINEDRPVTMILVTTTPTPHLVIDVERFSSWNRILKTIIFVVKFITRVMPRAAEYFGASLSQVQSKAEIILFRMAQMEDPPTDDLRINLPCTNAKNYNYFGTRIKNAALPMETTHPVLLPRNSYITSLFVIHVHEKNFHTGTEQTLVELRKSIWIPKGRTTVKKIINKLCFVCKKSKAKPYKLPNFPDLPITRVKRPNYPFKHCGMGTLVPMQYRNENQTTEKCWILLWTCLSCRAIVVDIIRDMSSKTFLYNLRQPLTYVADQTDHIPLRPIDFIRPTSRLLHPRFLEDSGNWKPKYSTRDELIKEWKFGINLLDQFWSRWSKEYLTSLKERYKLSHPHLRCYQRD
uniref:Integrase_H2C2 domain-containing protein n=1 Tax=Nippostrongylus brasiliensis TaxID=27835 RepID=A0A0N4XCD4_NIPBR